MQKRHEVTLGEMFDHEIRSEIAAQHGGGLDKALWFIWHKGVARWELIVGKGGEKRVESFNYLDPAVKAYNNA